MIKEYPFSVWLALLGLSPARGSYLTLIREFPDIHDLYKARILEALSHFHHILTLRAKFTGLVIRVISNSADMWPN